MHTMTRTTTTTRVAKGIPMRFLCETCGTMLQTPAEQAGQPWKCEECQTYLIVPKSRFTAGSVIGDYALKRELGHGAMGTVYLARQLTLERQVALKVLHPAFCRNATFIENFVREARIAANLNHPNIVQCYAVGVEHENYYLAMEYVSGKSLRDLLDDRWRLATTQALEIVRQVAVALQYAWRQQRLVHRDIKPENIMLTEDGTVKLADLGIARPAHELLEDDSDQILGTPQYLSPEYVIGRPLDFRSDIYSLGAVLYQCVTGHMPFTGDSGEEIARKQVHEEPKPPTNFNADLPVTVVDLIARMMAKDPDDRFQDPSVLVSELTRQLDALQGGGDSTVIMLNPGDTAAAKLVSDAVRGTPVPTVSEPRNTAATASRAAGAPGASGLRAWRIPAFAGVSVLVIAAFALAFVRGGESSTNATAAPASSAPMSATALPGAAPAPSATPLAAVAPVAAPVGTLYIAALLPDPEGDDMGNEKLRLANPGAAPVALEGWTLRDKAGATMAFSGEAAPGETVLTVDRKLRLNNTEETVELLDPAGAVVHTVHYEKSQVKSGEWVVFAAPATP